MSNVAVQKLEKALAKLPDGTQERLLELTGLRSLDELAAEWDVTRKSTITSLRQSMIIDLAEDEVLTHQVEWAEEEFGKGVSMNNGWSMEDGCITSKIYGHGILTTWYDVETGEIIADSFEEFE